MVTICTEVVCVTLKIIRRKIRQQTTAKPINKLYSCCSYSLQIRFAFCLNSQNILCWNLYKIDCHKINLCTQTCGVCYTPHDAEKIFLGTTPSGLFLTRLTASTAAHSQEGRTELLPTFKPSSHTTYRGKLYTNRF